jgi:hypothetical protein
MGVNGAENAGFELVDGERGGRKGVVVVVFEGRDVDAVVGGDDEGGRGEERSCDFGDGEEGIEEDGARDARMVGLSAVSKTECWVGSPEVFSPSDPSEE